MAIVFGASVPVVDYGRNILLPRYQSLMGAPLEERLGILRAFYSGDRLAETGEDIQSSVARICYLYVATFAMANYDAGKPGFSLGNFFAIFIPRFLWPDKPIMTDIGIEFNVLANGSATSASGPGLFAEAYWNFGWFGIPILIVPLGVILLLFGRYAMWILNTGRWAYFPLVLLLMRTGLRVDGFFTVDVFASIPVLIILHTMGYGAERLLSATNIRRATA
jgi:hypothetical protein